MKILIDTNFILTCIKQKIDLAEAEEILEGKIDWLVPQDVLNELGNLKDRPGMKIEDKTAAKVSFEVLQTLKPEIIQIPGKNPNIDMKILSYILGKEIILATLDKAMKQKTENKILTIRGRKGLEII